MTDTPSSGGNAQIIRTLYQDFARADVAAVLARFAPDIEWTEAEGFPYAGTYHGGEAIVRGVFARLATEWDGYRVAPTEFIDGGDQVVVLGEYTGAYRQTGRSFRAPFAHVWTLAGGRVTRYRQFTDTALVQRALAPA